MLSPETSRAAIERAIKASQADEVFVTLAAADSTNLRFARNGIMNMSRVHDHTLTVRAAFGKRHGPATVKPLDPAAIERAVRRAEELARLAPEDPEFVPGLGPQTYPEVAAYFEGPATGNEPLLVRGAGTSIEAARRAGLVAAGYIESSARTESIGNSRGFFGYHRYNDASFSVTARTADADADADAAGSGCWASSVGNRLNDLDFEGGTQRALDKARQSQKPRPLTPGKYVTILEPACVADLVGVLMWNLDARRADEGRSFFSAPGGHSRLGQRLFPAAITIVSEPADARCPATPLGRRRPGAKTDRLDPHAGKLENLAYSRYWGQKQGRQPLPPPSNVIMAGGRESLADLIVDTDRGG